MSFRTLLAADVGTTFNDKDGDTWIRTVAGAKFRRRNRAEEVHWTAAEIEVKAALLDLRYGPLWRTQ